MQGGTKGNGDRVEVATGITTGITTSITTGIATGVAPAASRVAVEFARLRGAVRHAGCRTQRARMFATNGADGQTGCDGAT